MIEHGHPTTSTQKHVLAASGNQCAFPGCSRPIFDLEHETLIGTVAHIRARRENGPRFDPCQSEDDNKSFANLLAMCAEHSKIIDGAKWKDFSVECLATWKAEHEQQVAASSDRTWIRPPNSITRMSVEGQRLHFSYWVDRTGRPRLFSSQQLAVLNALMSINLLLLQVSSLTQRLDAAEERDVGTVLKQELAKLRVERSVIADLSTLFAMVGNVTFAEFLGFLVQGNDPTPLIQESARRLEEIAKGGGDAIVTNWFKSDHFS